MNLSAYVPGATCAQCFIVAVSQTSILWMRKQKLCEFKQLATQVVLINSCVGL